VILSNIGAEALRFEDAPDVGKVESLEARGKSRPSLLVGMVEFGDGDVGGSGQVIEMVVVELAHLATLVLGAFEVLVLAELEGPLVEEFVAFVRPFGFYSGFVLELGEGVPLEFGELLELNVSDFVIIEILVQEDIKVSFGGLQLLLEDGFHFIGEMSGRSLKLHKITHLQLRHIVFKVHRDV
jgi:hypothetical protein